MEAVIFVGVQGSGKSAFYRERFFDTHLRINLDMLRTRHRESLLLHACLEMKQPFVVDNTSPASEQRAKYVTAARAAGFRVVGYAFDVPLRTCLERNAARPAAKRIPVKAILGTHQRLRWPSRNEGFDQLYRVRPAEDGGFQVEEWPDAV